MGAASYGMRRFKGRARVSGERPIGAGGCRPAQQSQGAADSNTTRRHAKRPPQPQSFALDHQTAICCRPLRCREAVCVAFGQTRCASWGAAALHGEPAVCMQVVEHLPQAVCPRRSGAARELQQLDA